MRLLFAVILAACLATPARAADTDAIRQLVHQFQSAIVARDGKTLGSLFVQDGGSWLSVLDDAAYADAKTRNPAAKKLEPSTWQKFADFVQHSARPVEECFYDVRIDTNGSVASVWFDFDFLVDGKVTNRGSETWQLVRTDDVFMALRPQLERLHVDVDAPLTVVAVMAAGVAGGWVLYRCVETPFMRLRARWTAGSRPARLVPLSAE